MVDVDDHELDWYSDSIIAWAPYPHEDIAKITQKEDTP
jgi:hypothetical protein